MALNNSCETSKTSTYKEQNAVKMCVEPLHFQLAKINPGESAARVYRAKIVFCFILPLSQGWM